MTGEWFRSGWRCTQVEEGVVHVTPVGDLVPHQLDDDCVCGPRVEIRQSQDGPDGHLHVHPSLDGRESTE